MSAYPSDFFDGIPRSPMVVSSDQTLTGTHQGGVYLQAGHFRLDGHLQGSLSVEPGASAEINGELQGSIHIARGATAVVNGWFQGSAYVEGSFVVERGATASGSIHNDGSFIVRGRQEGRSPVVARWRSTRPQ